MVKSMLLVWTVGCGLEKMARTTSLTTVMTPSTARIGATLTTVMPSATTVTIATMTVAVLCVEIVCLINTSILNSENLTLVVYCSEW